MALKIIGAGFGRTATLSLKYALERLGFGPCHHMSEVISNAAQTALWSDVTDGKPDFGAIFSGYSSAVDFPTSAYWQDVLATYPNSKVVLNLRDPDDWYESFSQTILPLILDKSSWPEAATPWFKMIEKVIIGKALGGKTDKTGILAAYRENEATVRALAKTGRALVFQPRDGWQPLCTFLGVEVPTDPYPKSNERKEFFSNVKSGTEATAE
jgi:hypothetical protein